MSALIDFAALPWHKISAGSRSKVFVRGGQRVRLLELREGFVEPEWCRQGHAGRVLEGSLSLRTRAALQRLCAGDVFVIEPGDEHAHKAELGVGERALLLLFEPLEG